MRAPRGRVVLVGLAAVAVLAGGVIATRHGSEGVDAGAEADAAGTPTGTTTGPAGLGSLSDRLRRLPELRPGELDGTLRVVAEDCRWQDIPLISLRSTGPSAKVCAAPGAAFGIAPLVPGDAPLRDVRVVDLDGRPSEQFHLPTGARLIELRREGLVFCTPSRHAGRLRRFGGGTEVLPGCPLNLGGPLLFAGPGRRSIVDAGGHRIAVLRAPLDPAAAVRMVGDGVLAVGTAIYRDGRLLAVFDHPGGVVLGASRDGRVAIIGNGTGLGLFLYRDGVVHPLDMALAAHAGAVAPDGTRLLVQHGDRQLIELDSATLRPLARLELTTAPDNGLDWLPADG
jgi:hypothetical protein